MGKARDLFKKIGDTKGTFHPKMSMIEDRNCKELTEVERLKRGVKSTHTHTHTHTHTQQYEKDLTDPDNHDGVIIHLKPGILESEVKRALGSSNSSKPNGGDVIPPELFQILKDDAVKVLHSIFQ